MIEASFIPIERVESRILTLRGQKVMIDRDLAELYGVTTKRLREQIRRNSGRFPEDFLFQLSRAERDEVAAKCGNLTSLKFSPSPPFAFTEHGAIMAASVLNSERAVAASVYVVRAFVKMREIVSSTRELEAKMVELEHRVTGHDENIQALVSAIRQLMAPPEKAKKGKMGF